MVRGRGSRFVSPCRLPLRLSNLPKDQNEVSEDKVPEDIGRLRMAFTMEQRCEMLTNQFGVRYYHDWKDYEE